MRAAAMMAVVIGCFGLILAASFTPAAAAACQTFGPGPGTATLSADITAGGCGATDDPLLEVIGPFTLDMAGFKVDCGVSPTTTGIRLLGSGAILKNGLVQGCTVGVVVDGTGSHKVQNVVAKDNGRGFDVQSNKNELTNSSAVHNGVFPPGLPPFGPGFLIAGNQNKLDHDVATDNSDANFQVNGNQNTINNSAAAYGPCHGFRIQGDKNKVTNSTSTGTPSAGCDGFLIVSGSSLNELTGNGASDNEGNGFQNLGNTNTFKNNTSTGNDRWGFRHFNSNSNTTQDNVAVNNGFGGIQIAVSPPGTSQFNLVKGNRTHGNPNDGIQVQGTLNTVTGNTSLGNSPGTDLHDTHSDCDSNSWTKDIFGTSNPSGVSATCIH